tara:strand:- start:1635 stop:1784 length:150 start_codon:yes stop_codon:yes gene_type:complete
MNKTKREYKICGVHSITGEVKLAKITADSKQIAHNFVRALYPKWIILAF